jgi:hypothetical protein
MIYKVKQPLSPGLHVVWVSNLPIAYQGRVRVFYWLLN